ncbi:IclR family transcriptional regulator [Ruegeria sp. SCP11]|uniref:IclR family transcriptional regulator n=1 Tax=Ruegeria sp. SCP11 TaxID=3141378 RepID=UPI0033377D8F
MATKLNGSVVKSFEILGLFSSERREISANTVADELGMTLATAHRFLTTLTIVGALTSYRRGVYCLGHRIEELGRLERETNPLASVVKPIITAASIDLNESVMASRFSQGGPICMAVSPSNRPININIKVGTILPIHSTAQGKIWLSTLSKKERTASLAAYSLAALTEQTVQDNEGLEKELDQIRAQGFALNRGENEPDLGAVSVPVFSDEKRVFLTLSTFGLLSRFDDAFVETAVERLNRAAREIVANCT